MGNSLIFFTEAPVPLMQIPSVHRIRGLGQSADEEQKPVTIRVTESIIIRKRKIHFRLGP